VKSVPGGDKLEIDRQAANRGGRDPGSSPVAAPRLVNGENPCQPFKRGITMNIYLSLGPLAALIAGILILAVPRLLNYIVALYLIIIGALGLFGPASQHLRL
jgi:hypothetical protein